MQSKGVGVWMLASVLALVVAGCAQPPAEEKNAAQAAKNAAVAAQAESYAAAAMNEAVKLWDDAETKMQAKVYPEAKQGYAAAKAAFEKAASEVEAGKAAVMEENKAALAAMEQAWSDLGKVTGKKIKKMQADVKNNWENDSRLIQDAMAKAKENANPAEIKNILAEAKSLAEKWLETFGK